MSITVKRNPGRMPGSIRPAQKSGLVKAAQRGKLKAPGPHLSAVKTRNGSAARSLALGSKLTSAAPGPAPRTLPEGASLSRSWPAPYRPSARATSVAARKTPQARSWICGASLPCR